MNHEHEQPQNEQTDPINNLLELMDINKEDLKNNFYVEAMNLIKNIYENEQILKRKYAPNNNKMVIKYELSQVFFEQYDQEDGILTFEYKKTILGNLYMDQNLNYNNILKPVCNKTNMLKILNKENVNYKTFIKNNKILKIDWGYFENDDPDFTLGGYFHNNHRKISLNFITINVPVFFYGFQ